MAVKGLAYLHSTNWVSGQSGKHSSLFFRRIKAEEKSFIRLTLGVQLQLELILRRTASYLQSNILSIDFIERTHFRYTDHLKYIFLCYFNSGKRQLSQARGNET
jgi:hypothetical protein